MTQKYRNRIFLVQNESTSSRQCMSACTVTKTQDKNRIPYVEKTFEMFSVVNFSEQRSAVVGSSPLTVATWISMHQMVTVLSEHRLVFQVSPAR